MTQPPLAVSQVRNLAEGAWDEVVRWFSAKPGIFTLPHPEQQILFELADRLRRAARHLVQNHNWDRLYFDATTVTLERALVPLEGRRPPIYVDTRQLFGLGANAIRDHLAPDLALSVQVLRSAPELLELDDDGKPRKQSYGPASVKLQGWLLEEHVRHLEELSGTACDGFLFIVYSNDAQRQSPVDLREVASWATWQRSSDALWWSSRHFRARARG
jgi:hypothetical protein